MSKVLSVRIDEELYTKCIQGEKSRKETVTQALNQYFNTKQKKTAGSEPAADVTHHLRQQINQMKAMQDHMTDEILYLRDLHQNTMSRVLQIPAGSSYDRDPIQNMQNPGDEETDHHQHTGILTKLGNVIDGYKTAK